MKGDRAFGLVTLVVALAYIASATQIQSGFIIDPLGSKAFPVMIGSVAAACGLYIMLRPDDDPSWPARVTWIKLGISLAVLLFYAFTLRPLGFLIPTAIASALLSYQIHPNRTHAIVTGLCLSVGLLLLFKHALGLGLQGFPRSWFG